VICRLSPSAQIEAFPGVPVRRIQEIKPIASPSFNQRYIFNLGQNFAGVVRLKVKGPAAPWSVSVTAKCFILMAVS